MSRVSTITSLTREHRVLLLAMQAGGSKQEIGRVLGWGMSRLEYRQNQMARFLGCANKPHHIVNKATEAGGYLSKEIERASRGEIGERGDCMPHYTVIENVDGFTLMCLGEGNWKKNARKFHGAHFHKSDGWTRKLVDDALSVLRLS